MLFRSPRSKLVLTVCLLLLSGCGQNVCLVSDVPLPPFGQRVSDRAPAAAGASGNVGAAPSPVNWMPTGPERKWRFIIVHHSASESGNAAKFDRDHRNRGWDELGYHFVIGNGTMSGDGQIEVGPRWVKQKHGSSSSPVTGTPRKSTHIHDTTQLRLGCEYLFILEQTIIPLRLGVFTDPQPSAKHPDDYFGISVGTGIMIGNAVLDCAYIYRWGDDVAGEMIGGATHSYADVDQHMFYMSMIYHF